MMAITPIRNASGTYPSNDLRRAPIVPFGPRLAGCWPTAARPLPIPLRLPTFCATIGSLITLLLSALIRVRLRLCSPELDLVLELDSLLASHAFTNLFRQRECIFRARVLAFGNDEVCMHWRNHRAAATLTFHSHLVDDLTGTDSARRRIFEKTTSRTRAVRLRREPFAFGFIHPFLDAFRIVGCETQRRAQ